MRYLLLIVTALIIFSGCHDVPYGYLKTDNAEYLPDSLVIPLEFDPENWSMIDRVKNNAPWVTGKIEGVLGTSPLIYTLLDVEASEGGDAEMFKKELEVRGAGIMQFPLYPESPKGRYVVSLNVRNDGHSADLLKVFTFILR